VYAVSVGVDAIKAAPPAFQPFYEILRGAICTYVTSFVLKLSRGGNLHRTFCWNSVDNLCLFSVAKTLLIILFGGVFYPWFSSVPSGKYRL
jgi:hypothetical protein